MIDIQYVQVYDKVVTSETYSYGSEVINLKAAKTRTLNGRPKPVLVREIYQGEPYRYYPLGKHIVAAPGICGGRPTFKYTRLEVSAILSLIAAGESVNQVVKAYSKSHLSPNAVVEAIRLADRALVQSTRTLQLAA